MLLTHTPTHTHTDTQTNKNRQKHNLLGGGNNSCTVNRMPTNSQEWCVSTFELPAKCRRQLSRRQMLRQVVADRQLIVWQ